MSRGYREFFGTAVILLILICLALMTFVGCSSNKTYAYADINALANRSTRHYLPQGYENNGSAIEKVVHWKDLRGVGNLGIGNGSLRTMLSDVTLDPSNFMLPKNYMAGDIGMAGMDPSVTIGKPQKDIFHEFPFEPGTMYGKLIGVPVPGGKTLNMGVRSIGYGYFDPKVVEEKIGTVAGLLNNLKNDPPAT
jgi:hypothetical protein